MLYWFHTLLMLTAKQLHITGLHANSSNITENCDEDISEVEISAMLSKKPESLRHKIPDRRGVDVFVETHVQGITALSDTSAEFEIDILFSQIWVNHNLGFAFMNSCKRNITLGSSFLKEIWYPNICLVNTKSASIHHSPSENMFVILYQDGTLWVNYRIKVVGPCELNLRMFPFDTQQCTLAFESYSYNSDEVRLNWLNTSESVPITFLAKAVQLPDFDIVNSSVSHDRLKYPNGRWDRCTATFAFERRYGFYIIQAYVPMFVIIATSWIGFCMDTRALPARTTVGVSALLALTFQFGNIIRNLPKVSYIKGMDIWMLACVAFVFATLIELAVICYLVKSTRDGQVEKSLKLPRISTRGTRRRRIRIPMPKIQKGPAHLKCSVDSQGQLTVVRRKQPRVIVNEIDQDSDDAYEEEMLTGNPRNNTSVHTHMLSSGVLQNAVITQNNTFRLSLTPELIDKVSMYLFPLMFSVFNIAYWWYYISMISSNVEVRMEANA